MTQQAHKSPKIGRSLSLRSFVRRHKRLLAFIGATLVLSNYILGDWLRESAKDAADDARSSTSELQTQIILNQILAKVGAIDDHQMGIATEAVRAAFQHGPAPVKPESVDDVRRTFEELDASSRGPAVNTVEVMRQFDEQVAKQGDQALANYNNVMARLDRELSEMKNQQEKPDPDKLAAIRKQVAEACQSLTNSVDNALGDLNKRMNQRNMSTARTFSLYERWSIYVYVIGWLVALAGQVMGVDGLDGD
jgi:succinate dehydrogenase flavin-adding protein (antitoxin of CptAB toxin-antitoxin module)